MKIDEIISAVREGKELYVPVGGQGLGIENIKSDKVSKADLGGFLRAAKARVFKRNPISPNQADYVNWILYDRIAYAAAAVIPNLSKLFVAPISATKTKVDTNLELVSSLPAPQWMNVTGVGVYFNPTVIPADIYAYINAVYMEFWVSQKVYLEGPLDQFPSAGGVVATSSLGTMTAAAGNSTSNTTNGWPSTHNLYDVRLPAGLGLGTDNNGVPVVADGILGVTILQGQTFHIELKADGGGPTLQAATGVVPIVGAGLTVGVRLHGILSRGVQ